MLDIYDRRVPVNNIDACVSLAENGPLEVLEPQLIGTNCFAVGVDDICRATSHNSGKTSDHHGELTGDHTALVQLCRMHLKLLSGEANHAVHANSMGPKCLNPI
ncbi:hypothetical protein [Sorangium cellulosum]|uniref:hypothetical protein n=1 Tax=Sorangium cellulosum TaxID=56 RepID=UPI001F19C220|nr:hypothetical protein [Sorangium cellulosum]